MYSLRLQLTLNTSIATSAFRSTLPSRFTSCGSVQHGQPASIEVEQRTLATICRTVVSRPIAFVPANVLSDEETGMPFGRTQFGRCGFYASDAI